MADIVKINLLDMEIDFVVGDVDLEDTKLPNAFSTIFTNASTGNLAFGNNMEAIVIQYLVSSLGLDVIDTNKAATENFPFADFVISQESGKNDTFYSLKTSIAPNYNHEIVGDTIYQGITLGAQDLSTPVTYNNPAVAGLMFGALNIPATQASIRAGYPGLVFTYKKITPSTQPELIYWISDTKTRDIDNASNVKVGLKSLNYTCINDKKQQVYNDPTAVAARAAILKGGNSLVTIGNALIGAGTFTESTHHIGVSITDNPELFKSGAESRSYADDPLLKKLIDFLQLEVEKQKDVLQSGNSNFTPGQLDRASKTFTLSRNFIIDYMTTVGPLPSGTADVGDLRNAFQSIANITTTQGKIKKQLTKGDKLLVFTQLDGIFDTLKSSIAQSQDVNVNSLDLEKVISLIKSIESRISQLEQSWREAYISSSPTGTNLDYKKIASIQDKLILLKSILDTSKLKFEQLAGGHTALIPEFLSRQDQIEVFSTQLLQIIESFKTIASGSILYIAGVLDFVNENPEFISSGIEFINRLTETLLEIDTKLSEIVDDQVQIQREGRKMKYSLLDLLEEQMVPMPALGAGSAQYDSRRVEDPFDIDQDTMSLLGLIDADEVDIDETDVDTDLDGIPNRLDDEDDTTQAQGFGDMMERFLRNTHQKEDDYKKEKQERQYGLSHAALLKKKYYGRY